jgi:uncharacterized repeat protein (TIGR02543 family)
MLAGRRRRPLQLLIALALALCVSPRAGATVVIPVPEHELVLAADAIVVGRVEKIASQWDARQRQIFTWITLSVGAVLKGDIGVPEIVLKQPGGTVGTLHGWVHGSPEFRRHEHVLVFLTERPDGTLGVTQLYQGKFSLTADAYTGEALAMRDGNPAGVHVLPGPRDARAIDTWRLSDLEDIVRAWASRKPRKTLRLRGPAVEAATLQASDTFTFMSTPGRWIEPDSGLPVTVFTNLSGEPLAPGGGFEEVREALAAWTMPPTASLVLVDGGLTDAVGLQYDGVNSVSFRDPLGQIPLPSGCAGVLAIGGYYVSSQTSSVGGLTFYRIIDADLTIADGWSGCGFYESAANFAEVLTHEVGHMVGFGHNSDPSATMYAYAHFDGRGASLTPADIAGLVFLYPGTESAPLTTFTLTVTRAGTGLGTVTSVPAGIACGADCSEPFASGAVVALTATAQPGYAFAGWSGACAGTAGCSVTMTADRAVTATFVPSSLADLVVQAVSEPPANAGRGSRLTVTDTVRNIGGRTAGATYTRYYLAAGTTHASGDVLLAGYRSVSTLVAGATSTGTVTVTVPLGVPTGTYHLLACADGTGLVAEGNEANNCLASSGTVVIGLPDLVTTAVANPPATVIRGSRFQVTDTVKNQGQGPSAATWSRYYLSLDGARDATDRLLSGSRSVPILAVGASSTGTVTVVVPSTMPFGTYVLLACADDTKRVLETADDNNCRASSSTIAVTP